MDLCQSLLNISHIHCVSCSVRGDNQTSFATICPEKLELATAPQCSTLQGSEMLCCLYLFPSGQKQH